MDSAREILELRQDIAQTDAQIVRLLDHRARAARRIGQLRKDHPPTIPAKDPAAIRELVSSSTGDMPAQPLKEILTGIFAACLSLELPVQIAFVAPEGGPAHTAAAGRFGQTALLRTTESIDSALAEVSKKEAEFAVVPFETESESPVQRTIAALVASELRVVEVLNFDGGGGSRVRFAVVGARPSGRTGNDRTLIVFGVDDAPGSLIDVLKVFTERGIDLKKLQSHPISGENWKYLFCGETAGHFTDRALVGAFEEIKRMARFFKLLGSYPG